MRAPALVGTWRLERWEVAYGDGRPPGLPYGGDAEGRLIYTPDGHMLVAVTRRGRPPLSSARARSAPDTERLAAFDGFFCYGGRYEIRGDRVVHHVAIALNPGLVGTQQVRHVTLRGKGLTLAAEERRGDSVRRHLIRWIRA